MNVAHRWYVEALRSRTSPFFGTTTGPQKSSLNGASRGKIFGSAYACGRGFMLLNFIFRGIGEGFPLIYRILLTTWIVSPLRATQRLR